MICRMCRRAGRLLQDNPDMTEQIQQYHEHCDGGTWCACQHKLAGVNHEMVRLSSGREET